MKIKAKYNFLVTGVFAGALAASLGQPAPPSIVATTSLQHQPADIGTRAFFTVAASGATPLAYQWRLDGQRLAAQTNRFLIFSPVRSADEGDYTVVVTNMAGAVTSAPIRLWVTPPAAAFVRTNFSSSLGRLPYAYVLPTRYDPMRSYPLYLLISAMDESGIESYTSWPALKVMVSYRQQERDPVIELIATRRAGTPLTSAYLRQLSTLLDQFIAQFNVDTNRIYIAGGSEAFHGVWDMVAMRPGFFAGACMTAGWQGTSPAADLKGTPVWAWVAQDDDALGNPQLHLWASTRQAVEDLRAAGGSVNYTEYIHGAEYTEDGGSYGTHLGGMFMGCATPAITDWLLAQRRAAPSTAWPLLSITNPTARAAWPIGATNLSLVGWALAPDADVLQVTWTNFANQAKGIAAGTNSWSVTGIPLMSNRTNAVAVAGVTTSWAPACGGNTTFNDTLMVACYPIQATLTWHETGAVLDWTGGGPPYRVQRATDLAIGNWTDLLVEATPPMPLSLTNMAGFYRIVGQ